jgi:hypothetical protein
MICYECECEMLIWKSSVDIPIYFGSSVVTAFPLSLSKRRIHSIESNYRIQITKILNIEELFCEYRLRWEN